MKEIILGTFPGNASSKPKEDAPSPGGDQPSTCEQRDELSDWSLCAYDPDFAFKRVHLDFCGKSPTFAEYKTFRGLAYSQKREALAATLEQCMQSAFFRGPDGFVWKLAHEKITPLQTIKSGENRGPIALGDYDDDYHLFVYHHLDDRDVRGLLTAQYYVVRDGLTYSEVDDVPLHPQASGVVSLVGNLLDGKQQFVPRNRRAGMLTTLWFAVNNTMFTSIPRTTAAQALRAYLDTDIAKSEGLIEPKDSNFQLIDYDSKGITDPACSFCHTVLDAAAYPFSKYNGLSFNVPGNRPVDIGSVFDENSDAGLNIPGFIPQFLIEAFINNSKTLVPGIYKTRRMEILGEMHEGTEPRVDETPEAGYLFGQRVNNLVEWAALAANSDEFVKAVVKDYWREVVREPIDGQYADEFSALWQGLKSTDQYSVRRMLHRLIMTEAYGAP